MTPDEATQQAIDAVNAGYVQQQPPAPPPPPPAPAPPPPPPQVAPPPEQPAPQPQIIGLPTLQPATPQPAAPKAVFSPFLNDQGYQDSCEIHGGEYFYRLLAPETQEYYDSFSERVASTIGVTVGASMEESLKINPNADTIIRRMRNELWARIIDECLVAWSYPVPCDSAHKAQLTPVVQRALVTNIVLSSGQGASETQLFRERDLVSGDTR
jgi:hypothetical protein